MLYYCSPLHKLLARATTTKRPPRWPNLGFLEFLGSKKWENYNARFGFDFLLNSVTLIGLYGAILGHTEPYGEIRGNTGKYVAIRGHRGPYYSVQNASHIMSVKTQELFYTYRVGHKFWPERHGQKQSNSRRCMYPSKKNFWMIYLPYKLEK